MRWKISLFLFVFSLTGHFFTLAQTNTGKEKGETIHVKKPSITIEKRANRISNFFFTYAGHHYKIIFPPTYKSNLYLLILNNQRIAICDGDKNIISYIITYTTFFFLGYLNKQSAGLVISFFKI